MQTIHISTSIGAGLAFQSRKEKGQRFYFEPRNDFLKSLVSKVKLYKEEILDLKMEKYPIISAYDSVIAVQPLYNIWKASGTKLSFSKALSKLGVPSDVLAKFFSEICESITLELTTHPKAIYGMSESTHFTSCLQHGGAKEETKAHYALESNMALIRGISSAGTLLFRATIFSVEYDGLPALIMLDPYGISKSTLKNLLPKIPTLKGLNCFTESYTRLGLEILPLLSKDSFKEVYDYGPYKKGDMRYFKGGFYVKIPDN